MNKGLLVLLGIAGVVWYVESQTGASATSTTQSSAGAAPAPPGGAPVSSQPTAPAYTGPSLAQMYTGLQAKVAAALGKDPALSCSSSGMSGLGIGTGVRTPGFTATSTDPIPVASDVLLRGGHPAAVAGGIAPRTPVATSCDPTAVYATYDVFNYYLLQAAPGVTLPDTPAGNPTDTLANYWAWATQAVPAVNPGLSGLGSMVPAFVLTRPTVPRSYVSGGWGV